MPFPRGLLPVILGAMFIATMATTAGADADKITKSANDLDRDVQKVDLQIIPEKAAEILGVTRGFLLEAVKTKGLKCSELVYLSLLAVKTGE